MEPKNSWREGSVSTPRDTGAVRGGLDVLPGPREQSGRRKHRRRRRTTRPTLLTSAALLLVGGLAGAGARGIWPPGLGEQSVGGTPLPGSSALAPSPSSAANPGTEPRPDPGTSARSGVGTAVEAEAARRAGRTTKAESVLLRARRVTAHQVLLALRDRPVRTAARVPGYARSYFGGGWPDPDGNGCDTRNDILRRDLRQVESLSRTDPCIVGAGILREPFTGRSITFRRTTATSGLVRVGHVVSLVDAWSAGASLWPPGRRVSLANDPFNLLAVDSRADDRRQGRDVSGWLPENYAYQCTYVSRQIAVKAKYDLSITDTERRTFEGVLAVCSDRSIVIGNSGVLSIPPRSLPPAGTGAVPSSAPVAGSSPTAGSGRPPGRTATPERAAGKGWGTDFHLGVPAV
ncbi:MAG: hypothetical protein QG608_2780 [Actinomycetota bacterium]|nr:hypothetical protein [Actinomycetota bacterium]